jgi:hypothetical protein
MKSAAVYTAAARRSVGCEKARGRERSRDRSVYQIFLRKKGQRIHPNAVEWRCGRWRGWTFLLGRELNREVREEGDGGEGRSVAQTGRRQRHASTSDGAV